MYRSQLVKELLPLVGYEIWLEITFDNQFAPIDVHIWVLDALKLVQYLPDSFSYKYSVVYLSADSLTNHNSTLFD